MRIDDPRRKWIPAANTDIRDTWKKHGFKPTTQAERDARQKPKEEASSVVQFVPGARRIKGPGRTHGGTQ